MIMKDMKPKFDANELLAMQVNPNKEFYPYGEEVANVLCFGDVDYDASLDAQNYEWSKQYAEEQAASNE